MKRLILVACVAGCSASNPLSNTNGDGPTDGGGIDPDLSVSGMDLSESQPIDLAGPFPQPDLRGTDFGGVACGTGTCSASQICCIQAGSGGVTSTCVAPGACADGGAAAACDGPEDCTSGMPSCCATLTGTMASQSGMATCTNSCPGSISFGGGFTVTTKLCHTDTDCVGYTGMAVGMSSAWDACCHNNMNPGTHFCANGGFGNLGGYTCP